MPDGDGKPMRFRIFIGRKALHTGFMETIEYEGVTLHRWNCGPSTFLARPEAGARLMNWNLRMADGSVRDVIHWPETADFGNFAKVRGGNPILFPFAGRSFANGKEDLWRDADGTIRPMPRHGFTRDGVFELTAADAEGFTATLLPDARAREAYPFDYRFSVSYKFDAVSFSVFFRLENLGDKPLPWSAGHHFYFTLPWHRDLERADYRFSIPAKKCFRHAADGSLEAVKPFAQEATFGDPEISDCIFTRLTGNLTRFGPAGGEEDIGIRLLGNPGTRSVWNAIVVWSESPESPFYCVEPWMGPPNAPGHGKGIHTVNPGETAEFGVEVALL